MAGNGRRHLLRGGRQDLLAGLADYGANAGVPEPRDVLAGERPVATSGESGWQADSTRAYVKFSGQSSDRVPSETQILDQVIGSGSYYACCYPKNQRPRAVRAGDTKFIGRLAHSPNDTLIYGRAIALRKHDDEYDNATQTEIDAAPWKTKWPRYVRVHHAEFIAGRLGNGISLNALMDELEADSFVRDTGSPLRDDE